MDIQRADFAEKLPTILKHISEAHFLSFDLELSGIPDQRRNRGNGPKSLAERYKELKIAAETYHILQVGLTCVEEDRTNAKYVVRSYNFNISPLVDEQLDLDRDFTYSTSAVSFLLRHSYNMASPFAAGIPYLTRAETHPAMENALARWDKQAIPDIKIKADDTKALNFMKRVRKEVDIWQKTKLPHKDYYDIVGVPVQDGDTTDATSLNRFEKRLVHQIVRAEYPTLQTFSRTEGVQVQPLDEEEQKRIKETLQQRLNNTLFNQVGFRWVAEAMAGGDLFGLDLDALGYIQGENEPKSREAFERRINTLRNTLAERKKVLIGHNCLLDLIYFFKTFYGPLPETVEEFQQQVHLIFPLLIDTKYLSTNPGSADALRFRSSQLWQVEQALTELEVPVFENGSEHASYEDSEQYHEAGFDSYITAKVFLKLAAKIASEHPQTWTLADASSALQDKDQRSSPSSAIPSKSEQIKSTGLPNKIFHKNPYDGLADLEDEEDGGVNLSSRIPPVAENPASTSTTVPASSHALPEGELDALTRSVHELRLRSDVGAGSLPGLIPRWDEPFWREFGNKLRVYGTVEEMCDLTEGLEDVGKKVESPTVDDALVDTTESKKKRRGSILGSLKDVVGKIF